MVKYCCSTFERANESGTDNEGYGSLLYDLGYGYSMGCELGTISFCPWCGKEVKENNND